MNISTRKTIIELRMDIIQEVVSEKRGLSVEGKRIGNGSSLLSQMRGG